MAAGGVRRQRLAVSSARRSALQCNLLPASPCAGLPARRAARRSPWPRPPGRCPPLLPRRSYSAAPASRQRRRLRNARDVVGRPASREFALACSRSILVRTSKNMSPWYRPGATSSDAQCRRIRATAFALVGRRCVWRSREQSAYLVARRWGLNLWCPATGKIATGVEDDAWGHTGKVSSRAYRVPCPSLRTRRNARELPGLPFSNRAFGVTTAPLWVPIGSGPLFGRTVTVSGNGARSFLAKQ